MNRVIKGIIFDVDGVLFDTEPLHAMAWKETARRNNFIVTDQELTRWVGRPCAAFAEYLSKKNQEKYTMESLLYQKETLFYELISTKPVFNTGLKDLLITLSGIFLFSWATSSPRKNVELLFRNAGILKLFTSGICLEDVEKVKPDPESYRKACGVLNLPAGECMAIDDSTSGVASASGAGLLTFGIEGTFRKNELQGAARTFQSTEEALIWIMNHY